MYVWWNEVVWLWELELVLASQTALDLAYLGHIRVHQAEVEEHESCVRKGSGRHCYGFFLVDVGGT